MKRMFRCRCTNVLGTTRARDRPLRPASAVDAMLQPTNEVMHRGGTGFRIEVLEGAVAA